MTPPAAVYLLKLPAKGCASPDFAFDETAKFMQVLPPTATAYGKRVCSKLPVRAKVEVIYVPRRLDRLRD